MIEDVTNKEFRYLWQKYRHLLFMLYYIVIGVLYESFNLIVTRRTYMYWPLVDDMIPFVKEMVIPYVIWYAYIVVPLVYLAFRDIEAYTKLCLFLFIGMTICFIIYAIFPNGQHLRPLIVDNDIFSRVIKNIYTKDNPINSAPSMHVLDSIAVFTVLQKSRSFKDHKLVIKISRLLMILIIASTVMIKQHSIIDLLAGIVLALILKAVLYSKKVTELVKKITSQGNILLENQPNIISDIKLLASAISENKKTSQKRKPVVK